MNKKIPRVYVNNTKKNDNNKVVFYCTNEKNEETIYTIKDIRNKINDIFKSNDFIYKKKVFIKTKEYEKEFIIISKNMNYLLTIDGKRIYINDILYIN